MSRCHCPPCHGSRAVPRARYDCPRAAAHPRARRTRTFLLIESVISTLVISVMLVAALSAVALVRTGEVRTVERRRGLLLAQMLMAEILQQAYVDPSSGPGGFGIAADELTGNRGRSPSRFDFAKLENMNGHFMRASSDQDLYDALIEYAPDGTAIPWASGYEQIASVNWVDPNNLSVTSGSETYVKRIVVTTKYQGRTVATLTAYRTVSWFDPTQVQGAPR